MCIFSCNFVKYQVHVRILHVMCVYLQLWQLFGLFLGFLYGIVFFLFCDAHLKLRSIFWFILINTVNQYFGR